MQLRKIWDSFITNFFKGIIPLRESEYKQLWKKDAAGLSTVFFEGTGQLGIAQNDAGKILFRCAGQVPAEVYQRLEERTYLTGEQLINIFGSAPFGYAALVIKASVIGLLREERVRISLSDTNKTEVTSIQDPGARSVFEQHRDFLRCEIEVNKDTSLTGRDRNLLRKFFEDTLGTPHIDSESDVLADLVFKHFTKWKDRISNMANKFSSLGLHLPEELNEFNQALTECLGNRQVQETLKRVKRNLDIIIQGMSRLLELEESLNEDTERELRVLGNLLNNQVKQLKWWRNRLCSK